MLKYLFDVNHGHHIALSFVTHNNCAAILCMHATIAVSHAAKANVRIYVCHFSIVRPPGFIIESSKAQKRSHTYIRYYLGRPNSNSVRYSPMNPC